MCFEIYEFDPAYFLSTTGLAWQGALKKTRVKLDPLTDIYVSLMVEKGIRDGIFHTVHLYVEANKNTLQFL